MEGVAGSLKFVRLGAGSPNPGARAQACRPTALSCRGGRFGWRRRRLTRAVSPLGTNTIFKEKA